MLQHHYLLENVIKSWIVSNSNISQRMAKHKNLQVVNMKRYGGKGTPSILNHGWEQ